MRIVQHTLLWQNAGFVGQSMTEICAGMHDDRVVV